MAVLLWVEQEFPDGSRHVVPTLCPAGRVIPKEERKQAERLDHDLHDRMPQIARELADMGLLGTNALPKWHALGERLAFVDDPALVSPQDRDSGIVWLAVRQHCPPELLPKGEEPLIPSQMASKLANLESERRLGKRHDHFERCYRLGKLSLSEVDWLTWSDFDALLESPGLKRDPRILPLLRERVQALGRRLKRTEFRAVCKSLRKDFPTKRRQRETSGMSEQDLARLVDDAFAELGLHCSDAK